jgi:hypothetical protein
MEPPTNPNILDYSSPIDSQKNIIESYPAQWYSDFLVMSCRIAQGDFNKKMNIHEIWSRLGLEGIDNTNRNNVIMKIVDLLANKSLIKKTNDNEISVTEEGVDFSVKFTREPYTNFGLLSPEELLEKSKPYLYNIYNFTAIKQHPIPITEIQELLKGIPHLPALKHMITLYDTKEWIKYDKEKQLASKTTEGLKYTGFVT